MFSECSYFVFIPTKAILSSCGAGLILKMQRQSRNLKYMRLACYGKSILFHNAVKGGHHYAVELLKMLVWTCVILWFNTVYSENNKTTIGILKWSPDLAVTFLFPLIMTPGQVFTIHSESEDLEAWTLLFSQNNSVLFSIIGKYK